MFAFLKGDLGVKLLDITLNRSAIGVIAQVLGLVYTYIINIPTTSASLEGLGTWKRSKIF